MRVVVHRGRYSQVAVRSGLTVYIYLYIISLFFSKTRPSNSRTQSVLNCRTKHCRTSQQSPKRLLRIVFYYLSYLSYLSSLSHLSSNFPVSPLSPESPFSPVSLYLFYLSDLSFLIIVSRESKKHKIHLSLKYLQFLVPKVFMMFCA